MPHQRHTANTWVAYDQAGRQVSSTNALTNTTTYQYDNANELTTVTDPYSQTVTTYTYEPNGRTATMTDADGHKSTYGYDGRNRQLTTTFTDTTAITNTFNLDGTLQKKTDQAGLDTKYSYDNQARLTQVLDPLGLTHHTDYTYDAGSNLLTVKDANSHVTTYTYDQLNRKAQKIWPDTLTKENYNYTRSGTLDTHVLIDNASTVYTDTYTYDALDQQTKVKYFDGTYANFSYTPTGQRQTVIDTHGITTTYGYDNQDRVVQVDKASARSIYYAYDLAGNRTQLSTTSDRIDYTFDKNNRLTTVGDRMIGTFKYLYDPAGLPTQLGMSNGITTTYGYDIHNRLTSSSSRAKSATGPLVASYNYVLGVTGVLTQVTELDGTKVNWNYDNAYRMTGETRTNGSMISTTTYQYDGVGNRQTMTATNPLGTNVTTYGYSANNLDQLTSMTTTGSNPGSASFSYDKRGNMSQVVSGTTTTFAYDGADRMITTTTGAATSTYSYDVDGRRVGQVTGVNTTNYLWDETSAYGDVLLETDGTNKILSNYALGSGDCGCSGSSGGAIGPLGQTSGGLPNLYLYDGQHNVRSVSDQFAKVTDKYSYDAYGNQVASSGSTVNKYRYKGQQLDVNTGLYDMRARYYNPTVGRFLSQDTADFSLQNPLDLNRYNYVHGDPINNMDPSGHQSAGETAQIYKNIAMYGVVGLIVLVAAYSATNKHSSLGIVGAFQAILNWLNSFARYNPKPVPTPNTPVTPVPSLSDKVARDALRHAEVGKRDKPFDRYARGVCWTIRGEITALAIELQLRWEELTLDPNDLYIKFGGIGYRDHQDKYILRQAFLKVRIMVYYSFGCEKVAGLLTPWEKGWQIEPVPSKPYK